MSFISEILGSGFSWIKMQHNGYVSRSILLLGTMETPVGMILFSHCWIAALLVFVIHRFFRLCIFLPFSTRSGHLGPPSAFVCEEGSAAATSCGLSPQSDIAYGSGTGECLCPERNWSSLAFSSLRHAVFCFLLACIFLFYYNNLRSLIFSPGAQPKKKKNSVKSGRNCWQGKFESEVLLQFSKTVSWHRETSAVTHIGWSLCSLRRRERFMESSGARAT